MLAARFIRQNPLLGSEAESLSIAREVKGYEIAFLEQTIRFYEFLHDHFAENGLRHIRKVYDERIRTFRNGGEIEIFVLYNGQLERWRMSGKEAFPISDTGKPVR